MRPSERKTFNAPEGFGKGPPLVDLEDFKRWILFENKNLLVLNKPGWLVCHPSKRGPFSSLVGAAKEYLELDRVHLISRLDRETSGLVLLAKNRPSGSLFQRALEQRRVKKEYLAIMRGVAPEQMMTVDQPLAKDHGGKVHSKQAVRRDRTSQEARTRFQVLHQGAKWCLCRVMPETGRKHQIRAHAEWLGCPIGGDKLYSGDPDCFLEFRAHGWTESLSRRLYFPRQALHAYKMTFFLSDACWFWTAPPPEDFQQFARKALGKECPEWTDTKILQ